MIDTCPAKAPFEFDTNLASASSPAECWLLLQELVGSVVGYKLFTVMTVDMDKLEASRAFTSHPVEYPVSGVKPITYDHWFEIVHRQQQLFVANTIEEIAAVFPDHQKIESLGCGSVVNIPVIVANQLVATINVLHAAEHFTPERIQILKTRLIAPSLATFRRVTQLAAK
jgi:GAF domain-containing protein